MDQQFNCCTRMMFGFFLMMLLMENLSEITNRSFKPYFALSAQVFVKLNC